MKLAVVAATGGVGRHVMEHVCVPAGWNGPPSGRRNPSDGPVTGPLPQAVGHSVPGGGRLSRADTAHLMLRVLDDATTIAQAIGAAN